MLLKKRTYAHINNLHDLSKQILKNYISPKSQPFSWTLKTFSISEGNGNSGPYFAILAHDMLAGVWIQSCPHPRLVAPTKPSWSSYFKQLKKGRNRHTLPKGISVECHSFCWNLNLTNYSIFQATAITLHTHM